MDHLEPENHTGEAKSAAQTITGRLFQPVAVLVVAVYVAAVLAGRWALQHLLPEAVTLQAFGHVKTIADLHHRLADRTLEIGFLLPGVFYLEYLWTGWSGSSIRHLVVERTSSARSDIVCYLLMLAPGWTALCGVASLGVAFISAEAVRRLIGHTLGFNLSIAGLFAPAQVAILFLVYSFCDYWSHRLDHSKLFWPLHRFHHAAESFAVVTASRVHPAAFTSLIAIVPAVLLGPSAWAAADVAVIVAVIRLIIHSRIESNFGWIGRWIVLSPLHHRLHHSLNRMPINLGLIPLWDRLFGTWREAPALAMEIGTPKAYRHGAWIVPDMARDYLEFADGALTCLRSKKPSRPKLAPAGRRVPIVIEAVARPAVGQHA